LQGGYQAASTSAPCSNSSQSFWSGTFDAASAMVDWRFAKKFDAYAGAMFSEVDNGFANGYRTGGHVNIDPTIGLRFRF
jgi:opacity protein-like surface antigen